MNHHPPIPPMSPGRLRLGSLPVNVLTDGQDSDAEEYIAVGVAVAIALSPELEFVVQIEWSAKT